MNQSESDGHAAPMSSNLFAAIELSSTAWVVALHLPIKDKISVVRIASGDVDRLLVILERARATVRVEAASDPQVHTCYEAGYDGFWLHRLLTTKGINNLVLDSASIQVSRRVNVPTPEEEDLKQLHRSRQTLMRERVRHVNRIKGLLKLQGVYHIEPTREGWMRLLAGLQTRDDRPFPARLMQEIRREAKLLVVVKELLREIILVEIDALVHAASVRGRRHRKAETAHPIAARLMQIRGIGPTFASVFATEVFYRKSANRRAVASYVGLTPTPYSSGCN